MQKFLVIGVIMACCVNSVFGHIHLKEFEEFVQKFEKKYNHKITDKDYIDKHILSTKGQNQILKKGRGAYYSSGSRPNQSSNSWAYARLASVITGGKARKVDNKIWLSEKR